MTQGNMAIISIGCIIIMLSDPQKNGFGLMFLGTVVAVFGIIRFVKDYREQKKNPKKKRK